MRQGADVMGLRDRISAFFGRAQPAHHVDSTGIERMVREAADRLAVRAFDAAETPAWTASWKTSGAPLNQDLEQSLGVLVARARDLFRNDVWARRVLLQFVNNLLGSQGMRLQMRLPKRGGALHESLNDIVETWWRALGKPGAFDVTRKLSRRAFERLVVSHLVRDGEFLCRMVQGRGPHGFSVQVLDPLTLDHSYRGHYGSNRIRLGVEIDADDAPVAYWLRAASDVADYAALGYGDQRRVRVPADEIIHFFIPEEAGQLRGYPWVTAGARLLWLTKDFQEAAAVASSNAAKRVGFFVSPNGEAPPGFADHIVDSVLTTARNQGKVLSPDEIRAITEAAQKFSTTAPGQYDVIPQGYDFKSHDSAYPHINHGEYIKECLRAFVGSLGMSHATGGNNLEAVNYSSANVGIYDEREGYKVIQEDIAEGVHDRIFAAALRVGLLASPLLARFPATRYDEALDCAVWIKRRWLHPDPLKKANANDIDLKNRLTSPQRAIAERGDDWEEIAEEIAQWESLVGPIGGGQASPDQAALAAQDEQDKPSAEQTDEDDAADAAGRRLRAVM